MKAALKFGDDVVGVASVATDKKCERDFDDADPCCFLDAFLSLRNMITFQERKDFINENEAEIKAFLDSHVQWNETVPNVETLFELFKKFHWKHKERTDERWSNMRDHFISFLGAVPPEVEAVQEYVNFVLIVVDL